jgi:serine/threonine-protein kinase
VYAVAAVLFEMIAGRPPFSSSDPDEVTKAHLERRAPRLDRVANASAEIADVVARALEKHPAARFPGARALSDALVAARGHATRSLGVPL